MSSYATEPGRWDDLVDAGGDVRTPWRDLVGAFDRMGPAEIQRRRQRADRLLMAEGASYVVHGDGTDTSRPWQVDPVPVLLDSDEWATVERGLAQRARLHELLLADLYGPQRLLIDGTIPPELVLSYRGFRLPAYGIEPPGEGRRLVLYGADLIRDANGRMLVLRERTDAPAGIGYSLVNRIALARLFPDEYRDLRVLRVARFFQELRGTLAAQAPPERRNPRVVILTSGVGHPTYFEQSYLAGYLGYNLVEGADLTVRDGQVWLRSLGELEPVDVILRRLFDGESDPLELDPDAKGGVAGLLQATREGTVGVANPLGTGASENPALQAVLPALAERLLGERLVLDSVPTLWCGIPDHRAHVLEHLDRMVLQPINPLALEPAVFAHRLEEHELAAWRTRIEAQPHLYAAQERVEFATSPVLGESGLEPGTIIVRQYAAAVGKGFLALPGGLARIVTDDTPIINQVSGISKDVWVLGRERDRQLSSWSPGRNDLPQIDLRSSLPSRAAEGLYWVGRNAERAEYAARLASVLIARAEDDPALLELADGEWLRTSLSALRALTGGTPPAPGGDRHADDQPIDLRAELGAAFGDRRASLVDSLVHLLASASSVRELMSTATWRVLNTLDLERMTLQSQVSKIDLFDTGESLDRTVLDLMAVAGLVSESMVRGPGWRFLDIGRRLERALLLCSLVETTLTRRPDESVRQPLYEVVLQASESLVVYRRRYRSDLELDTLLELLMADETNPRSLAYQLDRLRENLAGLPLRHGVRSGGRDDDLVADASARVLDAFWYDVARTTGPDGQLSELVQLVLDVRGGLLELGKSVVSQWFAHVGVATQVQGA